MGLHELTITLTSGIQKELELTKEEAIELKKDFKNKIGDVRCYFSDGLEVMINGSHISMIED